MVLLHTRTAVRRGDVVVYKYCPGTAVVDRIGMTLDNHKPAFRAVILYPTGITLTVKLENLTRYPLPKEC